MAVTIRHWLPILTFCPVNNLPDLIYVSLTIKSGKFVELYEARKKVRKLVSGRRMFMEDIASKIAHNFPEVDEVTVRLAFDRHVVTIKRTDNVAG
jgi:hypothetical protein